jgi:hypothetical protein
VRPEKGLALSVEQASGRFLLFRATVEPALPSPDEALMLRAGGKAFSADAPPEHGIGSSGRILYDLGSKRWTSVPKDYSLDPAGWFSSPPVSGMVQRRVRLRRSPLGNAPDGREERAWWREHMEEKAARGAANDTKDGTDAVPSRPFSYDRDACTWTLGRSSAPWAVGVSHWVLAWDTLADLKQTSGPAVQFERGHRYDLETHRVTSISAEHAPTTRSGAAFATVPSKFFVWGGRADDPDHRVLTDGAVYDWEQDLWSAIPETGAPETCGDPRADALGNLVLVQGGRPCDTPNRPDDHEVLAQSWSIYDSKANRWTRVSLQGAPTRGDLRDALQFSSPLYQMGRLLWLFDPKINRWTSFDLPQHPRQRPEFVALPDGRILAFDGNQWPTLDVYLLSPVNHGLCRLSRDDIPFFAKRTDFASTLMSVVPWGDRVAFWGRRDVDLESHTICPEPCPFTRPRMDLRSEGVIITLPQARQDQLSSTSSSVAARASTPWPTGGPNALAC